jgi:HlyB family type I secretion system ABC transporter
MSVSEQPVKSNFELDRIPLLALMPDDVRNLVEASFSRLAFNFGDVIVAEGDDADALYVLVSGTARAIKAGDHGEEVPLNVLRAGDAFGERALLEEGSKRTATVRASSPVEVLTLDRSLFAALVRTNPAVEQYVELHIRRHELRDFLRSYSAFDQLPGEALAQMLDGLEPVQAKAGEMVIRQGDPPGPLYVVRSGHLRAFIGQEDRAFLRRGDFFGEVSLFRSTPRTASVQAVSDCDLLALGPELFERLLAEHPEFRKQIEQRISQYDYKRSVRVPLDFADELLPADLLKGQELSDRDDIDVVAQASAAGLAEVADGLADEPAEPDGYTPTLHPPRRFPHVYQVDEMDCGAAALAIVCRYLGRKVSLTRIRQAVFTATDGTSLLGLAHGGEQLGLVARTVKASKSRLGEMPLPAIVHWNNNHWLVLYEVGGDHVRVSDPARGRRRVKRSEFEEKWSGYAAFFRPTEAFEQEPDEKAELGWLLDFFRPHRRTFAIVFGLGLVAAAAEMLIPVLSKFVVDDVIAKNDVGLLTVVVLGMFGALLATVIATVVQRYMLSRLAVRVDCDSLDFLSGKLLALPMSYFNARRTGDIERRLGGMRQVRQFMVQNGITGLASALQFLVALAIMFAFSWRLGLVYLATVPLYVVLMRYSSTRLRPTYDSLEESWGKYQSRQIDSIRGIETVKAMGAESALSRLLLGQFNDLSARLFRADFTASIYQAGIQLVSFLSLALFLWIGALEVLNHNLTVGGLVSFNALVVLANAPIVALLFLWDQLQYSNILLNRLADIVEQEPEQGTDRSRLRAVKTLSGQITFKNTGFQYPGVMPSPVLQDIDFNVEPGTTAAIVGRSGSGKTTLIKCLAGLLEPTQGTILYDGVDMKELDYRQLRRNIGFVLQENHMFSATIAENIAFGEERYELEQVMWAARIAHAAEFIERLPLGYETRIGETGVMLSGGQKQRVAIARAIYHRPPVLIFDEATSSLDTESERAVKESIDQLLAGRTSFVIAHRLSTVRDADVIMVLEQGRLVERGSHDELMSRQGLYYYLCSQQLAI